MPFDHIHYLVSVSFYFLNIYFIYIYIYLFFSFFFFFEDRRIEELTLLLSKFRQMNDIMTLVKGKFLNYFLSVLSDSQWPYTHRNHFIEICQKIFKIQKGHYNHALKKCA